MEFVVGETYSNRQRQYTVLKVERNKLQVRFDDGTTGTLDKSFQTRIITNMMRELDALTGAAIPLSDEDQRRFIFSIGFLAARADLQTEVPMKSVPGFEKKYLEVTGKLLKPTAPSYYPLTDPLVDKWGPELRIYFDASPSELNRPYFGEYIEVRDGHTPGQYRINSNAFFYKLLSLGFDLGPQQPVSIIRQRIQTKFRTDFDQGTLFRA